MISIHRNKSVLRPMLLSFRPNYRCHQPRGPPYRRLPAKTGAFGSQQKPGTFQIGRQFAQSLITYINRHVQRKLHLPTIIFWGDDMLVLGGVSPVLTTNRCWVGRDPSRNRTKTNKNARERPLEPSRPGCSLQQ